MSHNEKKQTYYAISKIEESKKVATQIINELPLLRSRLEKNRNNKSKARDIYIELQKQLDKLIEVMNTISLSLLEIEDMELADYSSKLAKSVKAFNIMTLDYKKLCSVLDEYLSKLPKPDITTNASIIGRLMNSVKMGYYPTELSHVKQIADSITFPEYIYVNILDPCCGCGLALQTLAQGHDCNTYGIELDRYRAEEALSRLNRVGFGSYFHSRINHEAFHLMLLNPPYLSVMTEGGFNSRSEKRFLVDSICHLLYGGIIIYIIPHYRLTSDICRVLCDNFDDLSVWRFTGDEFKKFKQIAVMGVRCKRKNGANEAKTLSELALSPESIPEISELPQGRYELPTINKKVDLFKGAEFNIVELAEQLNRSKSLSKLFEQKKLDNEIKRPLLPLNIGQVGLIGGSGLINGLVDCETPHIIKGRIIKENNIKQEETTNSRGDLMSTTVYETRVNKMIFNILTPKGFRSLS